MKISMVRVDEIIVTGAGEDIAALGGQAADRDEPWRITVIRQVAGGSPRPAPSEAPKLPPGCYDV